MAKGDADQVDDNVYVFADEDAAKHAFAGITSAETRACVRDFAAKQFRRGGDFTITGDIETGELNVDPVGDDTAASRFTFPVKSQGVDVDVTLDLVVARVDRGLQLLTLTSVVSTFDDDLRTKLTQTATRRLQRALAT